MPDHDSDRLRSRLAEAGQAHLWAHALGLPPAAQQRFLADVAAFDWAALRRAALSGPPPAPPGLRPPQALTLRRQQAVGGLRPRLAARGRGRLAAGEVATLLLAGGQGSRLGHEGPKGTYGLGPTPDRTLYAVLCERVVAAGRAAGRAVPLVVLVGPDTEDATREAFASAGERWGLAPGQVTFVRQGLLPALDLEGRALIGGDGRLVLAPDGHGGALPALERAGVLEALGSRGVRVLTTFQVDNPLARPLDPVLLGWMAERGAEVVGKAVRKQAPHERVGVFARDLAGRTRIVEYSELEGLEDAGSLTLGSIAVHALDLGWLQGLAARGPWPLPLHPARKRLGGGVEGLKLERFLFDAFPHAGRVEVQEVERAREFAPIKNATGEDSPASARQLVEAEVRRWHQASGRVPPEPPALRPLELDGELVDDAAGPVGGPGGAAASTATPGGAIG